MQLLHLDQEDGVDITANSIHPGCIYTNIVSPEVGKTIPKGNYPILLFMKSIWFVFKMLLYKRVYFFLWDEK
jgi:hypothetical protein